MPVDNPESNSQSSTARSSPIALIVTCQRLFEAFVVSDSLPAFDREWLNRTTVRGSASNQIVVEAKLFRGPADEPVEMGALLYFEGSDDPYPVFHFPSESPRGAAVKVSGTPRKLTLDEKTAVFAVQGVRMMPLFPDSWPRVSADPLDEELQRTVDDAINEVRSILDTLVGAYALYQYPLVWKPIYGRDRYFFIDASTKQGTRTKQDMRADNFIPFRLNASSRQLDGTFVDDVIRKAPSVVSAGLGNPLAFLKDSLWHGDIRTRFLLQFWIIEYAAESYASDSGPDSQWRECVEAVQRMVAEAFPAHLDQFKRRKGDLLRPTLAEKVKGCCGSLRVHYDEAAFKRAKRMRDSLSHGSAYDPSELLDTELYVREFARIILRRILESKGVFLEGDPRPMSELPVLTTTYHQAKHGGLAPLTASFTLEAPPQNANGEPSSD
jgi:hypothetical protein